MSKTRKQLEKVLKDTELKISAGEKEARLEDPMKQKAALDSLVALNVLRQKTLDDLKKIV